MSLLFSLTYPPSPIALKKKGVFQIDVHHLLGQSATFNRNAFIEEKLILNLRDGRTLNRRRMGHDRVEVEL